MIYQKVFSYLFRAEERFQSYINSFFQNLWIKNEYQYKLDPDKKKPETDDVEST